MPRVELSPQRYRELVEQSRGLICTHDLAGVLLSVNRAAADRLGYRPEDDSEVHAAEILARGETENQISAQFHGGFFTPMEFVGDPGRID